MATPRDQRAAVCATVLATLLALNGWADGEPEPDEEEEQEQALFRGMPDDEGRIEVFGFCGSCHSIDLVLQQGLSRSVWTEVIMEMVADHEMAPLPPDIEVKVLDYLEEYYGPDRKARKEEREKGDEKAAVGARPEFRKLVKYPG